MDSRKRKGERCWAGDGEKKKLRGETEQEDAHYVKDESGRARKKTKGAKMAG